MVKPVLQLRRAFGIHVTCRNLWFDAKRRQSLGVVTHAHSDHACWHGTTILTPATAALLAVRTKRPRHCDVRELPFHRTHEENGYRLSLLPAGHILGSAQVLLETEQETLLYTGDFKTRVGKTAEAAEVVRADTLVMETTFGTPFYRFPPMEAVAREVITFCHQTLESGASPVLLAYSLGKAQEILARLDNADLPIAVHPAIAQMTQVYERFGVRFPPYAVHSPEDIRNQVLLYPPNARPQIEKLPASRTALLSGWALHPRTKYQFRCDAAFPLSDHADYDELLAYVERVQPKRVFTVHGSTEEFARDLRRRGVEALALGGVNQLELALPL